MNMDEFLSTIYGSNITILSDKQKIQYEKDKKFLIKYFAQVKQNIERFGDAKDYNRPEQEYYRTILDMTKASYDPATIISNWVSETSELLGENSFVTSNLDEFIRLNEDIIEKEEQYGDTPKLTKMCSKEDVLRITTSYLRQIDPSMELPLQFKELLESGRIQFVSGDKKSEYDEYNDLIYYNFDGTLETANKLVHEFIHRVHYKNGSPHNNRFEISMFKEYPSIYYKMEL
jgi:hypothetical protein